MKAKTLLLIIGASAILGLPLGVRTVKKYGRTTYSHGLTYFGPNVNPPSLTATPAAVGEWTAISGQIFAYTLAYPKSLNLVQFPNDPNDSVGLGGPEKLILFVEKIDGTPKKFVEGYWQLYSGLAGLKNLKEITTQTGLTGFEANYTYKNAPGQSLDIFLEIKNDPNHLIHLMKGDLEEKTFREIVELFKFK